MEDFILKLKEETAMLHKIAERAGFNKKIFDNTLTKDLYAKYLINKLSVYTTLEKLLLENKNQKGVKEIYRPEIERRENILKDINAIMLDFNEDYPIMSSTKSYIYHLKSLAANSPELLGAHTYTNYLAEMAGGSMISKILMKNYNFKAEELNIYNFGDNFDFKEFQSKYHLLITDIVRENNIKEQFIEESKLSYMFAAMMLLEMVTE